MCGAISLCTNSPFGWAERKATVPSPSLWFDSTGMCITIEIEELHNLLLEARQGEASAYKDEMAKIKDLAIKAGFSQEVWQAMLAEFDQTMIEEDKYT